MENINDTIANAYFDPMTGFRGVQQTYKQVRKENPAITLKQVRDWYERVVAKKKNLRGYNSFVASKPKQEYQADLFFLTSGADIYKRKRRKDIVEAIDANKPAILMTDVFTKYTRVLPVENKLPGTMLHGLRKMFEMMGGKPEVLYTDEEGSFLSNLVKHGMEEDDVRLFATRGRAAFAERQIRTIKDMIVKRLAASGSRNWRDQQFLDDVCKAYNEHHDHRVTEMTPYRARMPENGPTVKGRLEANRRMNRDYPPIHIGDFVKILEKKKPHEKEQISIWSDKTYKVEDIGTDYQMHQTVYYTDSRPEPYLRHELLKVQVM